MVVPFVGELFDGSFMKMLAVVVYINGWGL